ncbi:MAG: SDR family NAD(P)-dependent oxidoreductase [Planctomycetota bacterium]
MAKTVLITGAGRGVGRECALAFARTGAAVACAARTVSEIDATAAACLAAGAPRAIFISMDVTNAAAVREGVERIRRELGAIDVLLHAAGGAKTAAFDKTDDATWAEMLSVNLTSAFFVARAVLPDMIQQKAGRILFVGSTASRAGFRYCSAYAAAKHGLLGMARSLALEVAEKNITVNVLGPGFLDAESTHEAARSVASRTNKSEGSVLDTYRHISPQRRLIATEEVAAAAVFLASDAARGINGQCLLIDGGGIVS